MRLLLQRLTFLAYGFLVVGCGGGGGVVPPPPTPTPVISNYLYVANGPSAVVYAPGGETPLRTITGFTSPVALSQAEALAFDRAGDLYVVDAVPHAGSVKVYAPGSNVPARTITNGIDNPDALAFDSAGNLYVANYGDIGDVPGVPLGTVTVYAAGTATLIRTIPSTNLVDPTALAFDRAGNLYVGNAYGPVSVYAAGGTQLLRVLGGDLAGAGVQPGGLAFDSLGNLYVAESSSSGAVFVYPAGASVPTRTLTSGLVAPSALAFDAAGNLYVANNPAPAAAKVLPATIEEFAAGSALPVRTIGSVKAIQALAIDGEGLIYAGIPPAGFGTGTVAVYSVASGRLVRAITSGISDPYGFAFGTHP